MTTRTRLITKLVDDLLYNIDNVSPDHSEHEQTRTRALITALDLKDALYEVGYYNPEEDTL